MKHLEFAALPRRVKCRLRWNAPVQNSRYCDICRRDLWQVNVFGLRAVVCAVRLSIHAIAQILRAAGSLSHSLSRFVSAAGKLGDRKSGKKQGQGYYSKYLTVRDGGRLHGLTSVRSNCNDHGASRLPDAYFPTFCFLGITLILDVKEQTLVDAGCMKIECSGPAATPD